MVDVVQNPAPQAIEHPGLRALYDYWERSRPGGRLPGRQHLDPLDIPDLLPNVLLIDVLSRDDFRFRLVGTALAARIGRDTTGLSIIEAYPNADWEKIRPDYLYVLDRRRPCLRWTAVTDIRGKRQAYQRLLLPLASDGEHVDMILAAAYWLQDA